MSPLFYGKLMTFVLLCFAATDMAHGDLDYNFPSRDRPSIIMLTRGSYNPYLYRHIKRIDVTDEDGIGRNNEALNSNYFYRMLHTVNAPILLEDYQ